MSEQNPSPEGTRPAKAGNPWRTATVVVAVVGAGLTVITGLAGFGIGLGVGKAIDADGGHHRMMAGQGFDGPDFDGRGFDGRDRHHGDHDHRWDKMPGVLPGGPLIAPDADPGPQQP